MRRTVATLLVVASPLLMVAPVGAEDPRWPASPGPEAAPPPAGPAPVLAAPPATPVPAPAAAVLPAHPAPVTVATPALPAPTGAGRAVARPTVKPVRSKAADPAAVNDAAYAARLHADLCLARQIFCGLDRNGRYPAG